ncbi:hypothetical protein ANCCAN_11071 [Ancylostoma caninum]|uniref:Uncharacterized protein n=1 Tax=Ancylostoma caninum TaxID=29170 RepID=A0A368GJC0_ANCCA|nr:hypothetical protein ANCCAN_11071 [Ancylostoma caninum]
MRLLVTVSLLLLTNTVISTLAEHVNIDVYSQTRDDGVIKAIRRVAAAINADNRYVVASVNERDCSDADQQKCSGQNGESVFVTINRYLTVVLFWVLTPACTVYQVFSLLFRPT